MIPLRRVNVCSLLVQHVKLLCFTLEHTQAHAQIVVVFDQPLYSSSSIDQILGQTFSFFCELLNDFGNLNAVESSLAKFLVFI
jgi:hypothetical protein